MSNAIFWEKIQYDGGRVELVGRAAVLLGDSEPICEVCGEREFWTEADGEKKTHARPQRQHKFKPVTLKRLRVDMPDHEALAEAANRFQKTGIAPLEISFVETIRENVRYGKEANCYTLTKEG